MPNILIIHDIPIKRTISMQLLRKRRLCFASCSYLKFRPESVQLDQHYLLIFEFHSKKEPCLSLIEQLQESTMISGGNCPPLFLIAGDSTESFEQAARLANVDFYFTLPITEKSFFAVVKQAHTSLPVK